MSYVINIATKPSNKPRLRYLHWGKLILNNSNNQEQAHQKLNQLQEIFNKMEDSDIELTLYRTISTSQALETRR